MTPQIVHHLSFSSIVQFSRCPRGWFSQRILGKPQTAGDAAAFGKCFEDSVCARIGAVVEPRADKPTPSVQPTTETMVPAGPVAAQIAAGEAVQDAQQAEVERATEAYLASPGAWTREHGPYVAQKSITITPEQWGTFADFYGAAGDIHLPLVGYIDLYREISVMRELVDLKTSARKGCEVAWVLQTMLYALATRAQRVHIHQLIKPDPRATDENGEQTAASKARSAKNPPRYRTAFYAFVPTDETIRWAMSFVGFFTNQMRDAEQSSLERLAAVNNFGCAWCPESGVCEANLLAGARPEGGTEALGVQ